MMVNSQKKYFPTGSDTFLNIGVFFEKIYLQFVNLKKNTSGCKIYFLRIPSPRILQQVGQGQLSRSWYFF